MLILTNVHVSFTVVMVAGVAASRYGQPATFECTADADGYFADHERNCVVYYYCENGERTG